MDPARRYERKKRGDYISRNCGSTSSHELEEGLNQALVKAPVSHLTLCEFGIEGCQFSEPEFPRTALTVRSSRTIVLLGSLAFFLSDCSLFYPWPTRPSVLLLLNMSDNESPAGSPANGPVDDGREKEVQDELAEVEADRDSDILSEINEDELEDYDPETANIEDRPVDIDEDIARTLKASKRKRVVGETPRKPREGRREKKRRDRDDDVPMDDTSEGDGKATRRARRAAGEGDRRRAKPATPEPENEETLSPEERRKRAIDRALDAAIKKGGTKPRRRKDEIVRKRASF